MPVPSPFRIELADAGFALGVRVGDAADLPAAIDALGLPRPRPTVVVVGGAASLEETGIDGLRPLFTTGIAPVMQRLGAIGVDGGTPFGVMRLFGEARVGFPLVGVVAAGTVPLSGVEAHHTHFIVVPGDDWGDEAPWIARTATVLAGTAPSITVLIGGGQIAYADVQYSIEAGRHIVIVAGSGGTADALAGTEGDQSLIRVVRRDQPDRLAELITEAFR